MTEIESLAFVNKKVIVVIIKINNMTDYEATTEAIKAIREATMTEPIVVNT